ncbi:AAA+-type ATPase [Trypanosoma rangeli]|uniref:AAA+-type ATPase n=1 Tax=Trypanosoma rangeli TaxID=5698 RepID=A0A422P3P3_TRYRA|nr:AAA+-type ATPase [Trypanosoma rangeli]RNF12294.1 AAA+-type ATPase [Trypanosoma rangeli]|eukprot:RNF12294.1 AAA+-type ATPase [Trypanosoma rangeli]
MDAYTSLLNLNFMSAWRTGNSLIDMVIAITIPLLSNWVARFFSVTWPEFVRTLLHWYLPKKVQVKIQHGLADRYQRAVDLTEGSVLQEAVERYISSQVKPFYSNGEFVYSMVSPSDGPEKKTMAQLLEENFKLFCRPMKESVNLGNGMFIRIWESEDKEPEKSEGAVNNGHRGRGQEKQTRSNLREIVFTENSGGRTEGDEVLTFTRAAFEWYVQSLETVSSRKRYLYQPLRGTASFEEVHGELTKVVRYPLYDLKSFNSLFFPEKEKLIALLEQFENKTGKFAVPGFPHKLILLLHGPPGTGKTSLVKAMAQYTGRHIFSVPLAQVRTNHELISCMHDQLFEVSNERQYWRVSLRPENVIYLLEDADATSDVMLKSKEKEATTKTQGKRLLRPQMDALSTKGLLEAFGGILDTPKRIIVMTTNHIDRLDSAIIRPGFVTMRLYMGNFTTEYAVQMVRHYYGPEAATDERLECLKEVLQRASETAIYFSPSELEQLCAEYDDIEDLIEVLKNGSREQMF